MLSVCVCIIIKYQRTKMSYLSIPTNFQNFMPVLPAQAFMNTYQRKPFVLPLLCDALKASFSQYSNFFYNKVLLETQQTQKKPENVPVISVPKPEEKKIQRIDGKKENLNIVEKAQLKEKIIVLKNLEQKVQQVSNQSITKEEIPLEKKEAEPSKKIIVPKQSKKIRKQSDGKVTSSSKVPKIDLIETAYIGKFGLTIKEMERKKNKLTLRRVEDWNEMIKTCREKREIRMLNH